MGHRTLKKREAERSGMSGKILCRVKESSEIQVGPQSCLHPRKEAGFSYSSPTSHWLRHQGQWYKEWKEMWKHAYNVWCKYIMQNVGYIFYICLYLIYTEGMSSVYINIHTDGNFSSSISMTFSTFAISSALISASESRKMKREVIYFLVSDLGKEDSVPAQISLLTALKCFFYLQQELECHLPLKSWKRWQTTPKSAK